MSRMYFMAQDSLAVSDEQHSRYFQELRDFASTSLHHVGESRRLAFRPPHVPQEIPLYPDPCRVQRAPRNTHGSQHGGGRRRRLRSPEPAIQTGFHGGSMATEDQAGASTFVTPQTEVMHERGVSIGHSRSPVTFPEFTPDRDSHQHTSEQCEGGEGTSTQIQDATLLTHITQVHTVVPNQPRRSQRIPKPTTCGTHGKLGQH